MKTTLLSVQQETTDWLSDQQERVSTPLAGEETNKADAAHEEEEDVVVAADDRTIFLTFSKGYPVSEQEVRVHFTKRFGEVIEAIEMQEVEENEKPLFAKMVLRTRCVSKLEEIVMEMNQNKFTIDGKHVWTRKYIRKNLPSSASSLHS